MPQTSTKTRAQENATVGHVLLAVGFLLIAAIAVTSAVFNRVSGSTPDWFGPAGFLVFLLAAFCIYSGGRVLYDAQPIPNEPIHAPAPLQLTEGESWRRPTSLRFLEKLKKELADAEKQVRQRYQEAVQAYEKLPHSSGRIEYDRHRRTLESAHYYLARVQETDLPPLRQRIEKVFGGDVGAEVLDLDENIKKYQRNKQEQERELLAAETECRITHNSDHEVEQCRKERESLRQRLRQSIHSIDFRIIELETDVKELREFDFKRLYREMGLTGPPGLLNLQTAHLQDIKTKADLINSIPEIRTKTESSANPRRAKGEEEIGRIVSTIDSIDELKRAWTDKKRNSPAEQHDLIDRLFRKAIDAKLEKL